MRLSDQPNLIYINLLKYFLVENERHNLDPGLQFNLILS